MAKKFLVDIDLNTNELQNAIVQNLPVASEPTGEKGRIYFDSTNNVLKIYNGTLWQSLATGGSTVDTVTLTGDVTGSGTLSGNSISIPTTIAANSVALGTDTTGDYVASLVAGSYIGLANNSGEGATPTISVDATTASTVSKVVARDASGDIYVQNVYGNLQGTANHANTASAINWTGITDKPDPVVAVYLSGDVTGNASTTLTDLASGSVSISTTIAANSVALGTDTTGNYVADVTASTGVNITGTPGEGWTPVISIGQPVATSDSPTFAAITISGDAAINGGDLTTTATGTATLFNTNATTLNIGGAATTIGIGAGTGNTTINNNLIVSGNLTVSGSVTTLDTQQLIVEDNIIVLNSNVTTAPSLDAGLEVERGTSTNVSILWNETSDLWTVTNDGTNYAQIARKYATTISSSAATSYTLTHNLNTRDITVEVYQNSANYDTVEVDVLRSSVNAVTINFAASPAVDYRVVITG